jgi:hypothetical protein
MSNGTIHSISPFMLQKSTSNPMVLDLMLRLWMDSSCVQQMVPSPQEHVEIYKKMEIYKMPVGTIGLT